MAKNNLPSRYVDLACVESIVLGKEYRDAITGHEGIATGLTHWLTGCDTVALQGRIGADGKVPDPEWFDTTRLENVVCDNVLGGPHDAPRDGMRR